MATAQEWWQRFCQTRISDRGLGFALDVSRVRFQDHDLTPLWPRMTQALAAMQQLEAGAIANPDENRMVGHYWLRAPQLAPTPAITEEIRATQAAVSAFAAKVHSQDIVGKSGP